MFGLVAVLFNIAAIQRDRQVRGVSVFTVLFFTVWGFWNVYYYPHLNQIYSGMIAGCLAVGNLVYFSLILKYKDKS